MRLQLTGLRTLKASNSAPLKPVDGYRCFKVRYCAVCKTDAKMWNEGHRDLFFPRVPGHELVVEDQESKLFTVWPGDSCGKCVYCNSGRENLCDEMKIMGFHLDGGFSDQVLVNETNLIPVPTGMIASIACLAEPVGCSLHLLEKVHLKPAERVVIFGAGTMGLILAMLCRSRGADVLIIEKNAQKIEKASPFLQRIDVICVKETMSGEFDVAINACSAIPAFAQCITKLAKGGRLGFFSGLTKNKNIETNLMNLIHYKEQIVTGAYGLTRRNMRDALPLISTHQNELELLIEEVIAPGMVEEILSKVLAGESFRYLLDFNLQISGQKEGRKTKVKTDYIMTTTKLSKGGEMLQETINRIKPLTDELTTAVQYKIDNKTKPLGSLGKFEALGCQAARIQNNLNPEINRKLMLVFAGDHGITEEGVSAYPSEVTAQMLTNFFNGGAAINVFCRSYGVDFKVIDMGVKGDFKDHSSLIKRKIGPGTRNFAIEAAMSVEEAYKAVETGIEVFLAETTKKKVDILGLGEIGIGNTTTATAIVCAVTGVSADKAAGRGTGLDDEGLKHKASVIRKALNFHQPDSRDGLEILTKLGGFELAGIAGAILAAASKKTIVVLDGVISTAAGLIAYLINPDIKDYLVSGHKSVEVAQSSALSYMGLSPVIDLDMRLGEGTGAAVTINLVETACRVMREMASFDDAGVSTAL